MLIHNTYCTLLHTEIILTHTYLHTYIHTYYHFHYAVGYAHSSRLLDGEFSRRFDAALVQSTGLSRPPRGTPGMMLSRHYDSFIGQGVILT